MEKINASIEKDELKISSLQEGIKQKKIKLKELEAAQILNNINSLNAKGKNVKEIIEAINNNDTQKLLTFINNNKGD